MKLNKKVFIIKTHDSNVQDCFSFECLAFGLASQYKNKNSSG